MRIEQGGRNLSGGQKQRLTVARALVKNAPILVLDDSYSALDAATEKAMRQALAETPARLTVSVSQRTGSVRSCDRILVLEGGRIIEEGSYDALIAKNGFFAELVARQRLDVPAE